MFGQSEGFLTAATAANVFTFKLVAGVPQFSQAIPIEAMESFSVSILANSNDLVLTMVSPSGNRYQIGQNIWPNMVSANISGSDDQITNYIAIIQSPEVGVWTLTAMQNLPVLSAIAGIATFTFESQLAACLFHSSANTISLGCDIVFSLVGIDNGKLLNGIKVLGSVRNVSDASDQGCPIVFRDDGLSGDFATDDGIYSSKFSPTKIGSYIVQAQLDGNSSVGIFQRKVAVAFQVREKVGSVTGAFLENAVAGWPK
jgi:hypothetical protein